MTLHHHLLLRFFQFWIILACRSTFPFLLTGQVTLLIFWLLELPLNSSALLSVQCLSFLTITRFCRLCRSHKKLGLHELLLKVFDPSNPSTYQIFAMIFFPLRFSKFRSPHCILTLKLLHSHCHLCWTNMLHSRPYRVHPRLKNHSSLLTFDLRRPNAQSWKPFTVDLGGPLIFKISKSNRSLFINSYLTLAAHITAQSFWHTKTIHANSGLL